MLRRYCSQTCASIDRRVRKITKTCIECGKIYDVLPCRINKAKFCSLICSKIGKVKTRKYTPKGCQSIIVKTCERCNRSFEHNLAKGNVARYCSKECLKRPKEKAVCIQCKQEYEYFPRDRHNSIKFCSSDCFARFNTDNSFWKKATKEEVHNYLDTLFKTRVKKHESGCWEWTGGKYGSGYGGMNFKGKAAKVHRIAYMFYKNDWDIPSSTLICHKCDFKLCFFPGHLFKGTAKDNYDDMVKKGRDRHLRGEDCPYAKITEKTVIEVLKLLKIKIPMTEIARILNINKGMVNSIKRKQSWKHVKI